MISIQKNFSLKNYNTFHVNAKADFFVEIFSEDDVAQLLQSEVLKTNKFFILWWGADILFTQDFAGVMIKISIPGREIISENETGEVVVKVWAGEDRHDFILRCVEHHRCWAENLSYIPGQVGSAPVQNIGAYWLEAKDIIHSVQGINIETWEKVTLTHEECEFSYRDSVFKHQRKDKIIITSVIFRLQKWTPAYQFKIEYKDLQWVLSGQELSLEKIVETIVNIRKSKLPDRKEIGTAGSFFKNPIISQQQYAELKESYPELIGHPDPNNSMFIKLSAGQLIDLAGFKGKQEWLVWTYDKHALVLINNGWTGTDVRAFAQGIQKKVLELFQVSLEPEVIIL